MGTAAFLKRHWRWGLLPAAYFGAWIVAFDYCDFTVGRLYQQQSREDLRLRVRVRNKLFEHVLKAVEAGDERRVLAAWSSFRRQGTEDATVRFAIAKFYFKKKDYRQAVPHLQFLLDRPKNVRWMQSNDAETMSMWLDATRGDPHAPRARFLADWMAHQSWTGDLPAEALVEMRCAQEMFGSPDRLHHAQRAVALVPMKPWVYPTLAQAKEDVHDREGAQKAWRKFYHLLPVEKRREQRVIIPLSDEELGISRRVVQA